MGRAMDFLREASEIETDNCIIFPFTPSQRYGLVQDGVKMRLAHRVMLELTGLNPAGFEVRHLCGVGRCVNRRHLALGNKAENEADERRHGTAPVGEHHPQAKLTDEIVMMIRQSTRPTKDLAEELGVHPRTVRSAKTGRNWSHL